MTDTGKETNPDPSAEGTDGIPRTTRVGQLIAEKYKVVRLLGEGGMGAVYEAQHVVIQRRFAIKFVHPELARRGEIIARFRREAQAAGGLENENIAAITDVGTAEDGAPYIVMEYLTGTDLSQILAASGPLPVPRATHLVIQACRGLDAAHARGIIHRDLKPENLFVTRRGDGTDLVKVLDFGIAKLRDSDGSAATQTGSTIGTPYYMPPEQARGAKDIDHRADVYALGVILYELLSGEKPHPGDGYNAIMFHILTLKPAPLASLRAGLPEGLVAVVERAMATDASDRFASVMDLAHALAPFVGRAITPHGSSDEPVVTNRPSNAATMATPVSFPELPAAAAPERTSLEPGGSAVSRPSALTIGASDEAAVAPKKSRTPLAIGAVAVLALLGLGAVAMATKGDPGASRSSPATSPEPITRAATTASTATSASTAATPPQVSATVSAEVTAVTSGHPEPSAAPVASATTRRQNEGKPATSAGAAIRAPKSQAADLYAP